MTRYWVRFWTESADDPRPVVDPRPCDWWRTGYKGDESAASVCAIVDTEGDPLDTIKKGWPEVGELDSKQEQEAGWQPPACRFPPYEEKT